MHSPRQARQGTALLSATTCVVCVAAAVHGLRAGNDRGLAPETAPGAGEATVEDLSRLVTERQALNERLYRDRDYNVLLDQAQTSFAAGRATEALATLQTILDASQDVFVWSDGHGPRSARAAALDTIRRAPPAARAGYEALVGADARRLWNEFRATENQAVLSDLLRRYAATEAGGAALMWSAWSAMDHGEMGAAARFWEQQLSDPHRAAAVEPRTRLWAEVAVALAAADGIAIELPPGNLDQTVRLAGEERSIRDWVAAFVASSRPADAPRFDSIDAWPLALGSPRGYRRDRGSIPVSAPLWTASPFAGRPAPDIQQVALLESDPPPDFSGLLRDWVSSCADRRAPCAGATFAVVVHDLVVAREPDALVARRVRTGEEAWRVKCRAGLQPWLCALRNVAASGGSDPRVQTGALFEHHYAGNSRFGMLAGDESRVYFIDAVSSSAPDGAVALDAPLDIPPDSEGNRLVAVSAVDGGQAWTLESDGEQGWYFLGPPLPASGRLYIIAERNREVHLLAIAAANGKVCWHQPIALVTDSAANASIRARSACCPSLAEGLVVCPTQMGTIVAVDAGSGSLRWVHACAEMTGPSQPWRGANSSEQNTGRIEFANLPLIVGGRVVAFDPQSQSVHCIDLHRGRPLWTVPRGDAQFAAAAGECLLLIGLRLCRGVSLCDGAPLWQTRIEAPTGRGVVAGDQYLLPASRGRILAIDFKTGRIADDLLAGTPDRDPPAGGGESDDAAPQDIAPLTGNLALYRDLVITCSPTGVAAYPQAAVALRDLTASLAARQPTAADLLRQAELELRLGSAADARRSLQHGLDRDPAESTRALLERRLCEVLYRELDGPGATEALDALDRLCRRPEQRARFLTHRMIHELASGRSAEALATSGQIQSLQLDRPVAMDACAQHEVVPERLALAALARHPRQYAAWRVNADDVAPPRAAGGMHAAALIEAGRLQRAELILLHQCRSSEPRASLAAAEVLVRMWMSRGLVREVSGLIDDFHFRSPAAVLPDGRRIDERLEELLPADARWRAKLETTSPSGRFTQAAIDETRFPDGRPAADGEGDIDSLASLFIRQNRECFRNTGGTLRLFDLGPQAAPQSSALLSVVDVAAPRQVARIELPPRVWHGGDTLRYDAGHFVPIVCGDVHGISLLEGRVMWTVQAAREGLGGKAMLGPFGPEYCIVQSETALTALDPHDGRPLWRRRDVDFDAGLMSDDSTGLFGDDRALVLFNSDKSTYRVFDPHSGEFLRGGRLDVADADRRKWRWACGRKLLYTSSTGARRRLCLWDPLTGECDVEEPIEDRLFLEAPFGHGLAAILNGRRLRVMTTADADVVWERTLSPAELEGLRSMHACCDRDRIFVHLERDVTGLDLAPATSDLNLPNALLGGDLYVIDRSTGEYWMRSMPRCNLLLLPFARLPVLFTVSRARSDPRGDEMTLAVDVIDAADGTVLATRNDLLKTPLVHVRCDATQTRIELSGQQSRISVQLLAAPTAADRADAAP